MNAVLMVYFLEKSSIFANKYEQFSQMVREKNSFTESVHTMEEGPFGWVALNPDDFRISYYFFRLPRRDQILWRLVRP